jgi:hypothetical protein
LNLKTCSLNDFSVPFTNTTILKTQQILTKENNFVFLNDYNQIVFCKFIKEEPRISEQNTQKQEHISKSNIIIL